MGPLMPDATPDNGAGCPFNNICPYLFFLTGNLNGTFFICQVDRLSTTIVYCWGPVAGPETVSDPDHLSVDKLTAFTETSQNLPDLFGVLRT